MSKVIRIMLNVLGTSIAMILFSACSVESKSESCKSDADCKGARICQEGGCVDTTGKCLQDGVSCQGNGDCCSNDCSSGKCQGDGKECQKTGARCSGNSDCCSEYCDNEKCQEISGECKKVGESCSGNNDCCLKTCDKGKCQENTSNCEGDWTLGETFYHGSENNIGATCDTYGAPQNCPDGSFIIFSETKECICILKCSSLNKKVGEACTTNAAWTCEHIKSNNASANEGNYCVPNKNWNLCTTGENPQCKEINESCSDNDECCSKKCNGSRCQEDSECKAVGESCSDNSECCSNSCDDECLEGASCKADGDSCDDDSDCCNENCEDDVCGGGGGDCKENGESCSTDGECCSQNCDFNSEECA